MPLIPLIHAAYVTVIATIFIGIFVEGRRAQLDNVLSNIISFSMLLATAEMPVPVVLGMVTYLGLGILIVARKVKDLYLLFGAKTYGSISLVILVAENQFFGLVPWVSYGDLRSLLAGCLVAVIAVHIIGYSYSHRRKRGAGGRAGGKRVRTASSRTVCRTKAGKR
jgi:hypothetical protein